MPQDTIKAVRASMAADKAAIAKIDAAQDAKLKEIDEMVRWCCNTLKAAVQPPAPVVVPPPAPPPIVVVSPPPPPPPTDDTAVTVSTTAEYMAALRAATANSTIRLRPGTYNGAGMQNLNAPNVTVTSYDPNNKAVITNFDCFFSSGITWRGVTLRVVPPVYYAFQVYQCRDIYFRGCLVYGSNGSDPQGNGEGISIQQSTNVGVVGCEFHTLLRAVAFDRCTNILIDDNHAHNLGVTFHMLAQIDTGSIQRNYITGYHVVPGDHPDGLQAFTDGTDASSRNLTFKENLVTRSDGNVGQQGIFLGVHDAHRFPFVNTVIDDNLLVGTGYNGINIGGAGQTIDRLQVTRNVLLSLDADLLKTFISIQGAGNNITITDNEAIVMSLGSVGVVDIQTGTPPQAQFTSVTASGNTLNTPTLDAGAARIAAWLAAHPNFTAYTLSL